MFSAKLFLLSAVVAAGLVQAAVRPPPKQDPLAVSVRYCEADMLAGPSCETIIVHSGDCTTMEAQYRDKTGSFAVGAEGSCLLFPKDGCAGDSVAVTDFGSGLQLAKSGIAHSLKSFRCIYTLEN